MPEIVHISAGQCGNHIGGKFFELVAKEHGIQTDGTCQSTLGNAGVYFKQTERGYTPRAVLVDHEMKAMNVVRGKPFGAFFSDDSIVCGDGSGGGNNNWAKGHNTEGVDLCTRTLDAVRKEAEACDSLQGFQLSHALGGGTGSGMGCLLLDKLKNEYKDKQIATYTVFSSAKVSDVVVEPYNALLSLPHLLDSAAAVMAFDNELLYEHASRIKGEPTVTYAHLNHIAANAMANVSAPMRVGATRMSYLSDMCASRPNLLSAALAPLAIDDSPSTAAMPDLVQLMAASSLVMRDRDAAGPATAIFRGDDDGQAAAKWNGGAVCMSLPGERSVTVVENTPDVKAMVKRVLDGFQGLFARRAFVHWYVAAGVEEAQFAEAEERAKQLLKEYGRLSVVPDVADN